MLITSVLPVSCPIARPDNVDDNPHFPIRRVFGTPPAGIPSRDNLADLRGLLGAPHLPVVIIISNKSNDSHSRILRLSASVRAAASTRAAGGGGGDKRTGEDDGRVSRGRGGDLQHGRRAFSLSKSSAFLLLHDELVEQDRRGCISPATRLFRQSKHTPVMACLSTFTCFSTKVHIL